LFARCDFRRINDRLRLIDGRRLANNWRRLLGRRIRALDTLRTVSTILGAL
jgi:hypothetical protein